MQVKDAKKSSKQKHSLWITHESLKDPMEIPIKKVVKKNPLTKQTLVTYRITPKRISLLEKQFNLQNIFFSMEDTLVDVQRVTPGSNLLMQGQPVQKEEIIPSGTTMESVPRVAVYYDERMQNHDDPDGDPHPECPQRIKQIMEDLKELNYLEYCSLPTFLPAMKGVLSLTHDKDYVDYVFNEDWNSIENFIEEEVYINDHSVECAKLSAGAVVDAIDAMYKDEIDTALCIIRPPGHHAEFDYPKGFCFFNNIAVAASYAQKYHQVDQVCIIDWDVHHGNGTQHLFENDDSVLYISSHRYGNGYYPGTGSIDEIGEGKGKGFNINIPFEGEYGTAELYQAFFQIIVPALYEFQPQLILISAGYDTVENDLLGGCMVQPAAFGFLTSLIMQLCQTIGAKYMLALEGGYHLRQTSACVQASLRALLQFPMRSLPKNKPTKIADQHQQLLNNVKKEHAPYWKCFQQ